MELSAKTIEHFRNPKNVGEIENPEGTGDVLNPICGDKTVLYLRIKEGAIEDAKFLSFGCAVTIASASVFTEKIKGAAISQLVSGSDDEVIKRLIGLIEANSEKSLRQNFTVRQPLSRSSLKRFPDTSKKRGRPS